MKRIKLFAVVLTVLLCLGAFAACNASKDYGGYSGTLPSNADYGGYSGTLPSNADGAASENGNAPDSSKGSTVVVTTDRMIVYTADVSVTVKDLDQAVQDLRAKLAEMTYGEGEDKLTAYESGSRQSGYGYATFTFRVPTQRLSDFLAEVKGVGNVSSSYVYSDDITDNYEYVQLRLQTLNNQKQALQTLLDDPDTSTSDKIALIKEINSIDAEIMAYTNTQSDYKRRVDYSTVNVTVYTEYTAQQTGFWQRLGETLFGSAESVGTVFGAILTAIVAMIPYLVIVGAVFGIVFLIRYFICKKRGVRFKAFGRIPKAPVQEQTPSDQAPQDDQPQEKN